MKKILLSLLLLASAFSLQPSAFSQIFGGVNTNYATVQCPTNSGPVYTNVIGYSLPPKTVIFTNFAAGQSNFTGSWVQIVPAQTNVYTFRVSLAGITNATWQTNIAVYLLMTNTYFWHADPGTNGDGTHWFTNGLYVN